MNWSATRMTTHGLLALLRRRGRLLLLCLALAPACMTTRAPAPMYTTADLAHLKFLEGRWKGTGPDGKPFFEAYDFPDPATFRSRRFPDASFESASDGSTVRLEEGQVVSRWGEFSWRAVSLTPEEACFEPVNAPSAFCWRRTGARSAEAVQRWTDEQGNAQSYTVPLERLP